MRTTTKTRKCFGACLLALLLLLPVFAQAETEQEFDLKCNTKTASACEVHDAISPAGPIIANIPAGTHVLVNGRGGDNWRLIQFYHNGVKMEGWANVAVVPASSIVRIGEWAYSVNENDPDYDAKMAQGTVERDVRAGWTTYLYDYDGSEGDLEKVSAAEAARRSSAYNGGSAGQSAADAPNIADISAVPVEVLTLGTAQSTVRYEGQERQVDTAALDFSAKDVPAEKALAVVYAPRTGKASLRATAASNAKVIKQCKAGTVVSVLEIEDGYSLVNVNGAIGYVRNDCLQYHAASPETEGAALLSYNGKTNGSTTINVRNAASGDSAKVAEWETGTEVTVFSRKDGWVEIEANGIHGWVQEKFVTVKE